MNIKGNLDGVVRHFVNGVPSLFIFGWAADFDDFERRPIVEILIDNELCGLVTPSTWRSDLQQANIGRGDHCFRYPVPSRYLDFKTHICQIRARGAERELSPPRHFVAERSKIALCAIVKNEARYLVEWICHHKRIGIDHFFIYDNESSDETSGILKEFENVGLVTIIPWASRAFPDTQTTAYNDFLRNYAYHFGWVGFLDADEFFIPLIGERIDEVLKLHDDASAVAFNWRVFGSSGATAFENRLVSDRFRKCATKPFAPNRHIKTFARPESVESVDVHHVNLKNGIYVTSAGRHLTQPPISGKLNAADFVSAQINHYFVKSKDEWDLKRARGMADRAPDDPSRIRPDDFFASHDRNEEDYSPSNLDRLQELISWARGLGPHCAALAPKW
ncbi:glycosyltransferase family 92 protein [Rhodoblastus sp. 17X3]|uniref:glycosyltransferase family 92 protein n=1 Tax=Rhodoblastus sp. 17X3 TaxID=3047026 RepID=UPI0024B76CAA|nr:glycosyltransferase family 92 protein [Rhodoblastus sp. 17X3]MDI9846572.1 glycosyltransferase family 92 protein [Rhodoblastus sp. 17X3]